MAKGMEQLKLPQACYQTVPHMDLSVAMHKLLWNIALMREAKGLPKPDWFEVAPPKPGQTRFDGQPF
jgi:hypothetical protein